MTDATLSAAGEGRWALSGVLDFATVPRLWPQLQRLLREGGKLTVSLAGVTRANSAGLVMLVEARDLARRSQCALQLVDLPSELLDLARITGCEDLVNRNAA